MQKGFVPVLILVGMLVILVVAGGIYYLGKSNTQQPKACTLEAKLCPDGSAVGRTGPNCEFAACPSKESSLSADETSESKICIQVIAPAKNSTTSECKKFPTPCDVPIGWEKVESCPSQ